MHHLHPCTVLAWLSTPTPTQPSNVRAKLYLRNVCCVTSWVTCCCFVLLQMCHLREFFIVHHLREKEDKKVEVVTIPKIHSQQLVLDLSGQQQPYEQLVRIKWFWKFFETQIPRQVRESQNRPEFWMLRKTWTCSWYSELLLWIDLQFLLGKTWSNI